MKMLILAVMILLLGFVINVSGQPQVTAKQHKNRPCKQPCNQMDDISPISSVRMSPPSDGEHSEQNSQKATDNPIGWHKFFTWPDGILAIAAILTFGAITWQSFETGRAARAMKKSVRLQEAALRQWVTVTDWESELLKDSLNLKISFQVNNPTDNPLQITAVFMNFVAIRKVEKVESAQWIAPKSSITAKTMIIIPQERMVDYQRSEFILTVATYVDFTYAVTNDWEQIFVRTLKIGPTTMQVSEDGDIMRRKRSNRWWYRWFGNKPEQ